MLKLKDLFENYALAKEALKHWAHDDGTLDEMLSHFRISSNAIYPFRQEDKVCFLRLAPVGEKLEKNVLGEIEFVNYLLARGYPALKPVAAVTGEECMKLDTEWGTYYAAVFEQVGGMPIEDLELSEEVLLEYGKALGRLHALSSEFEPQIRKWTHLEALNWMEDVLAEYHTPDGVVSALAELKRELGRLRVRKDTYGLIHYDFEPDNVFYDGEKKVCNVIDFDDGMYHWYALDVEQALDALKEELSGEALLTAEREFIRGYREEYRYTQETADLRPLMGRFIDLYGYARLIRTVAEKSAEEPEWLVELRGKLNRVILEKEARIVKACGH